MYISLLKIGALELEAPLLLAALANITDSPFRQLCRRCGAALVFTEMISAAGVVRDSKKTWALAKFEPRERPLGIQLFGNDPKILGEAAARLEILGADLFDVNFGCPVRKVLRIGAGAGFMEDPSRIAAAIGAVVKSVSRPVMAKFRSGPTADNLTVKEAARCAEAEGAAAVTVHARTTEQGFKGRADWDVIAQVKQAVKIPVIGNGDVSSAEAMCRMFEQTGCDGVMIGRAAQGNPWLFAECRAELSGQAYPPLSPEQKWADVEFHYRQSLEQKGVRGLREMRKYLGWYSRGLPGAAEFRARVFRLEEADIAMRTARDFFLQRSPAAVDQAPLAASGS